MNSCETAQTTTTSKNLTETSVIRNSTSYILPDECDDDDTASGEIHF